MSASQRREREESLLRILGYVKVPETSRQSQFSGLSSSSNSFSQLHWVKRIDSKQNSTISTARNEGTPSNTKSTSHLKKLMNNTVTGGFLKHKDNQNDLTNDQSQNHQRFLNKTLNGVFFTPDHNHQSLTQSSSGKSLFGKKNNFFFTANKRKTSEDIAFMDGKNMSNQITGFTVKTGGTHQGTVESDKRNLTDGWKEFYTSDELNHQIKLDTWKYHSVLKSGEKKHFGMEELLKPMENQKNNHKQNVIADVFENAAINQTNSNQKHNKNHRVSTAELNSKANEFLRSRKSLLMLNMNSTDSLKIFKQSASSAGQNNQPKSKESIRLPRQLLFKDNKLNIQNTSDRLQQARLLSPNSLDQQRSSLRLIKQPGLIQKKITAIEKMENMKLNQNTQLHSPAHQQDLNQLKNKTNSSQFYQRSKQLNGGDRQNSIEQDLSSSPRLVIKLQEFQGRDSQTLRKVRKDSQEEKPTSLEEIISPKKSEEQKQEQVLGLLLISDLGNQIDDKDSPTKQSQLDQKPQSSDLIPSASNLKWKLKRPLGSSFLLTESSNEISLMKGSQRILPGDINSYTSTPKNAAPRKNQFASAYKHPLSSHQSLQIPMQVQQQNLQLPQEHINYNPSKSNKEIQDQQNQQKLQHSQTLKHGETLHPPNSSRINYYSSYNHEQIQQKESSQPLIPQSNSSRPNAFSQSDSKAKTQFTIPSPASSSTIIQNRLNSHSQKEQLPSQQQQQLISPPQIETQTGGQRWSVIGNNLQIPQFKQTSSSSPSTLPIKRRFKLEKMHEDNYTIMQQTLIEKLRANEMASQYIEFCGYSLEIFTFYMMKLYIFCSETLVNARAQANNSKPEPTPPIVKQSPQFILQANLSHNLVTTAAQYKKEMPQLSINLPNSTPKQGNSTPNKNTRNNSNGSNTPKSTVNNNTPKNEANNTPKQGSMFQKQMSSVFLQQSYIKSPNTKIIHSRKDRWTDDFNNTSNINNTSSNSISTPKEAKMIENEILNRLPEFPTLKVNESTLLIVRDILCQKMIELNMGSSVIRKFEENFTNSLRQFLPQTFAENLGGADKVKLIITKLLEYLCYEINLLSTFDSILIDYVTEGALCLFRQDQPHLYQYLMKLKKSAIPVLNAEFYLVKISVFKVMRDLGYDKELIQQVQQRIQKQRGFFNVSDFSKDQTFRSSFINSISKNKKVVGYFLDPSAATINGFYEIFFDALLGSVRDIDCIDFLEQKLKVVNDIPEVLLDEVFKAVLDSLQQSDRANKVLIRDLEIKMNRIKQKGNVISYDFLTLPMSSDQLSKQLVEWCEYALININLPPQLNEDSVVKPQFLEEYLFLVLSQHEQTFSYYDLDYALTYHNITDPHFSFTLWLQGLSEIFTKEPSISPQQHKELMDYLYLNSPL